MSKRAVLYARVSSDDTKKDNRNLTGQLEMCREYAQQNGWSVIEELAEDDRGASGASFNLPQLNKALDMAKDGDFEILVTRELDRFARKLAKQLVIEEEFKRNGVQIEYVIGEYPDTIEGELHKKIRAVIAEYERDKIKERMIRGKQLKVKAGNVIVCGTPSYGYATVTIDNLATLEIIPTEAAIVKIIYDWYVLGDENGNRLSIMAIAKQLTDMQIPTWEDNRKNKVKRNKRGHWAHGTVSSILSNESYTGIWSYNKTVTINGKRVNRPKEEWLTVQIPAIIDRNIWEAAQAQKNINRQKSKRNRKYKYLLAGQLTCGHCGQRINGRSAKVKHGRNYGYYGCYGNRRDAVNNCNLKAFNAHKVDNAVWTWVKSFLLNQGTLEAGLKSFQKEREKLAEPLHQRLEIINSLIDANQTKLDRLLDLYLEGHFTREMLSDRKDRLETTIKSLEKEQVNIKDQLIEGTLSKAQIMGIQEFANKISTGIEKAEKDFAARRNIIELLEVTGSLVIENEKKFIYTRCGLGRQRLTVATKPS